MTFSIDIYMYSIGVTGAPVEVLDINSEDA